MIRYPPVFALLAICACDQPVTMTPQTFPALKVVGGDGLEDTVDARVPGTLSVVVYDSVGVARAGREVRFEAVAPLDTRRQSERGIFACHPNLAGFCNSDFFTRAPYEAADTTDAAGRSDLVLRFGTVAGPASIRITVPSLGLAALTSYGVLPGRTLLLRAAVKDSSAYAGDGYAINAGTEDRRGNRTSPPSPITYLAVGSAASISAGGVFHALLAGRGSAIVQSGEFRDTAWITVPPRGTLAFVDVDDGIGTINLDGSGYHLLVHVSAPSSGLWPDWTPSGEITYEAVVGGTMRLHAVNESGVVRRVTPANTSTLNENFATSGPNGAIYFNASTDAGGYESGVWMTSAIGAAPVRLGPTPQIIGALVQPSPSPDGSKLVTFDIYYDGLSILNTAAGTVSHLPIQRYSHHPRWSPDGTAILFNSETTLALVAPDGTNRRVAGPGHFYHPHANWSPDGVWIVARTSGRLELIRVATAETLPLGWSAEFITPAWKK